ncbi:response regulator transcription factor [Pirellulales bacterium]|nr:response regulator transcription factor [Pirellulales bacterium]
MKEVSMMAQANPIRVFVIDDHEVVQQGIAALLSTSRMTVVGKSPSGEQAIEFCRELQPDVILLDIRLQDGEDGLRFIKPLRETCPNCKVIAFTAFNSPTAIARAAAAGATDFILKTTNKNDLCAAIENASTNSAPHAESKLKTLTARLSKRSLPPSIDIPLTPREFQVLKIISLGLSNQEIADSLGISIETVKEHVQNILRKLQVKDRTQAAVWAVRQGFDNF